MSELPPEIAVEPEPTDADPPPEAVRPERPRIWPEEPRAPRPQIKRPMEEWLAGSDERVNQVDAPPREQPSRRRRPRGLARIVPVTARPEPPRETAGAETGRPATPDQQRRGRRRRRGGGGGGAGGDRSAPRRPPQPGPGQAGPHRGTPRRQSSSSQRPPGAPGRQRGPDRRPNPPRDGNPLANPSSGSEGQLRPPSGGRGSPHPRRARGGARWRAWPATDRPPAGWRPAEQRADARLRTPGPA